MLNEVGSIVHVGKFTKLTPEEGLGNNFRREIESSEEEQKFSREGRNIFLGEKLFQLLEKKRISI